MINTLIIIWVAIELTICADKLTTIAGVLDTYRKYVIYKNR